MKINFLKLINESIKKTWWYKSNYDDAVKMKNWHKFNLDLAVLGSSAVKHGLDFSSFEINAANWAMAPQNTYASFAILKNYHSFIKKNGLVLIMKLCPFGGMPTYYHHNYDKLHYFLSPVLLRHFSRQTLKKIQRVIECPLLGAPKYSAKALIKTLLGKDKPKFLNAKTDAQNRIDGWKKEFSIKDFADPLSEENMRAIELNTNLLCEMAEFCKECLLRPVFGVMPATKTLKDCIPLDFVQRAFYNMMEEVKERTGVQFLDFYRSSEFESEELYMDSFLLNENGRRLFTKRVLREL